VYIAPRLVTLPLSSLPALRLAAKPSKVLNAESFSIQETAVTSDGKAVVLSCWARLGLPRVIFFKGLFQ